ncbi:protein rolling stone-like [Drosophila kikkawai]|uniref:Protein rolling stone-like n=1 Tax=Drosophila kikkawai TaxID=30033 RepID=A0A6P4I9F5_DROKI|nr:protein rolling stone-like [Drosophila kikkawai]
MEGYNHSQEPLSLREEFRCKRFGLSHDSPFNFLRSQWQSKPKSRCFLVYRCLLGSVFGTGVITYTVTYFQHGHCFIYLTNWSFYMCGITSVYAAILQIVYHFKKESWVPPSSLIKCYWACFWITLCAEHLVAITYWTLIYPSDRVPTNPTYVSDLFNIWTHAVPPIVFTVDNFVVAQPARLMHFVYPVGFGLIYLGFTFIFYRAGGRDLRGRSFIYPFLDYSKPAKIALFTAAGAIALTAFSGLQYGVYRLRTCLAHKFGKLILDTS